MSRKIFPHNGNMFCFFFLQKMTAYLTVISDSLVYYIMDDNLRVLKHFIVPSIQAQPRSFMASATLFTETT